MRSGTASGTSAGLYSRLETGAIATSLVCAASLLAFVVAPWLGRHFYLVLYILAVVSAAWFRGKDGGLMATALALVVGLLLFIHPRFGLALPGHEIVRLLVFVGACVGLSYMIARHQAAEKEVAAKEIALKNANSRLNEVLASTTDCVQLLDRDWRVVYLNSPAMHQLPNGDTLTGATLWEAFPELENTNTGKEYRRAMRDKVSVTVTEFIPFLGAWFEVRAYPSETGLTVFFRDISERVRSEEHLQSVIETLQDPFVGLDAAFRYEYVNSAAEQQLRMSKPELIGRTLFDVFPGTAGSVAERNFRLAAEKRVPVVFEHYYATWNRWYEMRVSPAPTGGLSILFRDITERKNADMALADSEKRFRSTFENAAVGMAHVGNDGRWLRVNARLCEIVGYSRQELLARRFQDITHPDDVSDDENLFGRLKAGEVANYSIEKRYIHRNGHVVWVHLTTTLERSATGAPLYTISVIQDITQRKAAEHSLQVMNEDLKRFAYAASHDLQEPLRMVVTFTELLKRKYGPTLDSGAIQIIDYAIGGALRMEDSLRGLREYWLASEQRIDVDTTVEATDALQEALSNLQSAIARSGAEVHTTALPNVGGDMPGLVQVFQNLVGNAIKYARDGVRPCIQISAEPMGKQWLFRIADNGVGVPAEYRHQVFGLFKRLHGRETPGTGIGLALCQRIIERRGGSIWVDPESENGAIFCFTLPSAASQKRGEHALAS